ncbi:serine/threonine-protein kinase [Streptomyces sp. NPDC014870]|uniref:serine/threonine-protein kinase n=1 Tax=Streptomyces sp. NPDC014870 TaxID=3364925 RepID=UPI0037025B15
MRPLDASMPTEAGPYRLLTELGSGGMGRVFLGAAPDGRLAAVKQVHLRFAAEDGFRSRFRREVTASRKVSGAYTAAVMDADADAELPWLASVFVAGPSLGAAVKSTGPLPTETVRRLALGLVTALDEIHRVGLIHRDLKPENILLAEDGVRVIDFGIARAAEPEGSTALTQTGWAIGSPPFMSPEQAESKELTPASDVFSLGSVLALAATGRAPFAAASVFLTLHNVVHTEPDLDDVPDDLRPIVARCLTKDPARRPALAELRDLLGPVRPATRPWPPAVHGLIADQKDRLDELLSEGAEGDSARCTSAASPQSEPDLEPEPEPEPDPEPEPRPETEPVRLADIDQDAETVTAAATPPPPTPTPRPPRRGKLVALATVGAVALAGTGVGAYLLLRNIGTGEPDKYASTPLCADAAPKLPLPERLTSQDANGRSGSFDVSRCEWHDGENPATNWAARPHAVVQWTVQRTEEGGENGTVLQHEKFNRDAGPPSRQDTTVDFADEASWDPPNDRMNCSLNVRDGNLVLWVALDGNRHPVSTCESEARKIAEAAVSATPS